MSKASDRTADLAQSWVECDCNRCRTVDASALDEVLPCPDTNIDADIQFHEFVAEKPAWFKIGDTAKQFSEHPQE